jgi:hypothetical protein
MVMEKEFINYIEALALKELGFDEPCFAYFYHHQEYKILFDNPTQARNYNSIKVDVGSIFDNDVERVKKGLESLGDSVSRLTSIPLYQQAFSFFRDKYGLDGWVVPYLKLNGSKVYSYIIEGADYDEEDCELNTHEEAELECIKKLIEIRKICLQK